MFAFIFEALHELLSGMTIILGLLLVISPLLLLSSLLQPRVYIVIKDKDNYDSRI